MKKTLTVRLLGALAVVAGMGVGLADGLGAFDVEDKKPVTVIIDPCVHDADPTTNIDISPGVPGCQTQDTGLGTVPQPLGP